MRGLPRDGTLGQQPPRIPKRTRSRPCTSRTATFRRTTATPATPTTECLERCKAKLEGFGHIVRYTIGNYEKPIKIASPYPNWRLRGDARAVRAAGTAIGVEVQQVRCRASQHGTRAALWLGPDEYLLLGPEAEGRVLARALTQALQAETHSLVDVSHRQTALEISGSWAADMLNSGCPLDLDISVFPVGMCTRTVFAKAEVVLWRTAAEAFRIEVWRSFADYVARLLDEVAQEY